MQMPVAVPYLVQGHQDSEARQTKRPHVHVMPPHLNLPGPESRRDNEREKKCVGWCTCGQNVGQEDKEDAGGVLADRYPKRQECTLHLDARPEGDLGEAKTVEHHQQRKEGG